jgi:hypothetical protein
MNITTGIVRHSVESMIGWLGAVLLTIAAASPAAAQNLLPSIYMIQGELRTAAGGNNLANNVPAPYIHIKAVMTDANRTVLADNYTFADGQFAIIILGIGGFPIPDVQLDVEYVGQALDGKFVEVRRNLADANPLVQRNIENLNAPRQLTVAGLNLGTLHLADTTANIITETIAAASYMKANVQGWVMPKTLKTEARLNDGPSFVKADGSGMSIAHEDYTFPNDLNRRNAAFSDIHHEMFHWMAYAAYNNAFPQPTCNQPTHFASLISCEGFAMTEGSAQYFGSMSYRSKHGGNDQKSGIPDPLTWRGMSPPPNWQPLTGSDHSGEVVEGALNRTWQLSGDTPGQLAVFMTAAPNSMKQFTTAYLGAQGITQQKINVYLNSAASNGIVFTRSKFNDFPAANPPNQAPALDGNYKIIDDIAFLRGKVKSAIAQLAKNELNLAAGSAIIAASQVAVGYKPAVAGLNDANTQGFTFAPWVGLGTDVIFDTTTPQTPDNDYDLIAGTTSTNNWVDTFNPDFTADPKASVNTNEKWLKYLHTWYNREQGAPTGDTKGKVIVDNTGPVVNNFKPKM